MSCCVTVSYWVGLRLKFDKDGVNKHEAMNTSVCVATDVIPAFMYSSIDGINPVLLHFASVNHECKVSCHYTSSNFKKEENKRKKK